MASSIRSACAFGAALVVLALPAPARQDEADPGGDDAGYAPQVQDSSTEAADAIAGFLVADGFRAELFAAEPLLANPVCFAVDSQMRFYVAETFRLHAGVTDMREHMDWLDDELACRTVTDRLAMMRKHEGDDYEPKYAVEHERVRRIEDADGDGVAESATVFADGFSHPAAGIAAGLLPVGKDVYYACIPDMWVLRDADGDGVAEERISQHTGWGVHIALLGHDMHGIVRGPDGRLYWSIGDRGFHVEHQGRTYAHPHAGAVLRSELDGSNLEIFATGLRNPQELVFDDHGNLFTGDNNSDGGDRARWTYVLEGAEIGWRHAFQYVTQPNLRGPWNAEKVWYPPHAGQPAYTVPPIANFTDGPSGLTYYPGTGWGPDWCGHFFLCDFRGAPGSSGLHAFRNEPKGAGFELVDAQRFLWNSLVTDADFAPDGHLYVSDWVNGWGMTGKGRIYRIAPEDGAFAEERAEIRRLLGEGMQGRTGEELGALLSHGHQKVRLEAQWEIAERAIAADDASERALLEPFLDLFADGEAPRAARLHAIWGLGHFLRIDVGANAWLARSLQFAVEEESDEEVLCQLLRVLGQRRVFVAWREVARRLDHPSPRVRAFAAEALGRFLDRRMAPRLFETLAENDDADPWLRHALVQALVEIRDVEVLVAREHDGSAAVRRGAVVALRRLASPELARFLDDPDPSIVAEAARAIYDVPVAEAMGELAALLPALASDDLYLARRALNANRFLGGDEQLERVIAHCVEGATEITRAEALEILTEWMDPSARDRIVGEWRPLGRRLRNEGRIRDGAVDALFRAGDERGIWSAGEWIAYVEFLRSFGEDLPTLEPLVALLEGDRGGGARVRARALETLAVAARGTPLLSELLLKATHDESASVRAIALGELASSEPDAAIARLVEIAGGDDVYAAQQAVTILGRVESPDAALALGRMADELVAGDSPGPLALELLEALDAENEAYVRLLTAIRSADEALLDNQVALVGGDAAQGRRTFLEKSETSCLRCHAFGDEGGSEVGPPLSDVGSRLTRREILLAILDPNESIAEGYENWVLALDDGTLVVGRIQEETDAVVIVETPQKELVELDPAAIETRKRDVSSMPQDVATHLSLRELRDLVEFLATRVDEQQE